MAHAYRVLDDAENAVIAAAAHYARQSPSLATRFLTEYRESLRQVSECPNSGTVLEGYGRPDLRAFHLDVFPFTVCALVSAGAIVIVAVAHQSREPGYWTDRLGDL